MFSYEASIKERIEIGYLLRADPSSVYDWFRTNYQDPDSYEVAGGDPYGPIIKEQGRRLIEYLLIRRNDPIINHALAAYGYSLFAIQKAFDRGDASARFAALTNVRGGIRLKLAKSIILNGSIRDAQQIIVNPWIADDVLISIINRKGDFSSLDYFRLSKLLHAMNKSPKLRVEVDDKFSNPYASIDQDRLLSSMWSLTLTVPNTQEFASMLSDCLYNVLPWKPDNIDEIIQRWQIDKENIYDRSPYQIPSFRLRELLYNFKLANEALLESRDPAARMSFYRRFSPNIFKNWIGFVEDELDKNEFIIRAIDNLKLWKDEEQRNLLYKLCSSSEMLRDLYFMEEEIHREKNPLWFT
jgi:hypothetical protein